MIYNKVFNVNNQTAQPGTIQNIKCRFHHHKASKNIANFYACYDLMEVTTLSNLVALAIKVSGLNFDATVAHLNEEAFNNIIEGVYNTIDLLNKWETRADIDGEGHDNDDDEESDENEDSEALNDCENTNAVDTESEEDEVLNFHLG